VISKIIAGLLNNLTSRRNRGVVEGPNNDLYTGQVFLTQVSLPSKFYNSIMGAGYV
jgi:hypothetical protein